MSNKEFDLLNFIGVSVPEPPKSPLPRPNNPNRTKPFVITPKLKPPVSPLFADFVRSQPPRTNAGRRGEFSKEASTSKQQNNPISPITGKPVQSVPAATPSAAPTAEMQNPNVNETPAASAAPGTPGNPQTEDDLNDVCDGCVNQLMMEEHRHRKMREQRDDMRAAEKARREMEEWARRLEAEQRKARELKRAEGQREKEELENRRRQEKAQEEQELQAERQRLANELATDTRFDALNSAEREKAEALKQGLLAQIDEKRKLEKEMNEREKENARKMEEEINAARRQQEDEVQKEWEGKRKDYYNALKNQIDEKKEQEENERKNRLEKEKDELRMLEEELQKERENYENNFLKHRKECEDDWKRSVLEKKQQQEKEKNADAELMKNLENRQNKMMMADSEAYAQKEAERRKALANDLDAQIKEAEKRYQDQKAAERQYYMDMLAREKAAGETRCPEKDCELCQRSLPLASFSGGPPLAVLKAAIKHWDDDL